MPRTWLVVILLGPLAATQVFAADNDKPAEKSKGGSAIERGIDNTGKKLGKTADSAEKGVKRGLKAAEKGINTAGEKTGKAINSAADKTEKWVKEKTK
jgi:ElaB/YqjD/DUF883 family membrane-anchored ribosome-binding protein